jgi:hypothetical protein
VLHVDHALMGVVVPAGDHDVDFHFRSNFLIPGTMISMITVLALAAMAWAERAFRYLYAALTLRDVPVIEGPGGPPHGDSK